MNKNIYLIKKLVYKYKYILLALLVLLSLVYFFTPIVEGFEFSLPSSSSKKPIGMYEYLSPIYPVGGDEKVMIQKYNESISDDLLKRFMDKWNSSNCPENRDKTKNKCQPETSVERIRQFLGFFGQPTAPEINYYIDNGKWPYNQYVLDYAKNNPDIVKSFPRDAEGNPSTIDGMQKAWPVRALFAWHIKDKLMRDNNLDPGTWDQDKESIPLPIRIFSGKAVAPNSSSSSSFSSLNSSSNSSNLSDSDYQNLVSVCKTVVKNN